MHKQLVSLLLCVILVSLPGYLKGQEQEYNPILTAMPSLQIAPDARGGGMGDIGAATMPDVYSQHWNAAKYPFVTTEAGLAFSYTPWLNRLVNDINLLYASGFWKFGDQDLNVISSSIRYFLWVILISLIWEEILLRVLIPTNSRWMLHIHVC